jgi:hypothetical protein
MNCRDTYQIILEYLSGNDFRNTCHSNLQYIDAAKRVYNNSLKVVNYFGLDFHIRWGRLTGIYPDDCFKITKGIISYASGIPITRLNTDGSIIHEELLEKDNKIIWDTFPPVRCDIDTNEKDSHIGIARCMFDLITGYDIGKEYMSYIFYHEGRLFPKLYHRDFTARFKFSNLTIKQINGVLIRRRSELSTEDIHLSLKDRGEIDADDGFPNAISSIRIFGKCENFESQLKRINDARKYVDLLHNP